MGISIDQASWAPLLAVPAPDGPPAHAAVRPPSDAAIQRRTSSIEGSVRDIARSNFYTRLKDALAAATLPFGAMLPGIKCLVVYGLGSLEQPGAVHIRYQVALASLLAGLLPALTSPPEAYDPVFTPLDEAVLPRCGLTITAHNEEGKRVATLPTLFFMPHCEVELTENLLQANVAAGTLGNVVILGNSFAQYHERWSLASARHLGRRRPEALLELCESARVCEVKVDDGDFEVAAAFNDLSLHTFL